MKSCILGGFFLVVALISSHSTAMPILSNSLYYTGGDTNFVSSLSPPIDSYSIDSELTFGVFAHQAGYIYYMGDGPHTPALTPHANAYDWRRNFYVVGFKSFFGGEGHGYNNLRLPFSGDIGTLTFAPGSSTFALFAIGIIALGLSRHRVHQIQHLYEQEHQHQRQLQHQQLLERLPKEAKMANQAASAPIHLMLPTPIEIYRPKAAHS